MKKGFTLVELITVIIILGIISGIVFPVISKQIKSAKTKLQDEQINEIIRTSKLYTVNNTSLLPSEGSYLKVHVSTLISEGYLDSDKIINPVNDEEITGCVVVKYNQEYNQYEYQYNDSCILDNIVPIINTNDIIEDKGSNGEPSSYIDVTYGQDGGTLKCFDGETEITNLKDLEIGNYNLKCEATGENGKSTTKNIMFSIRNKANEPELLTNMIPIKYIDNNWVYASSNEEWYNYNKKEWANAVVLKSGVIKNVGDVIEEEDIALWYVWIPRYKYTIFNGNNEGVTEQLIDITFENGTNTTGTVMCYDAINETDSNGNKISEICTDTTQTNNKIINNVSTYTHPAFCLGTKNNDGSCNGEELTGFWFGKFEISGTESLVTVIPNATPLIDKSVSELFNAIKKISTKYSIIGDSHMAKNMEWGAVAYLKQSKYGLGLTDIGTNNYYNNEHKTGCGTDSSSFVISSNCKSYDTDLGVKASTTGNIYGVYDMSGGTYEYLMANMVNSSGEFYSSDAGFTTSINAKYYDKYTYEEPSSTSTVSSSHSIGKLGDATKETLKTFGNTSGGWYNSTVGLSNRSYSWLLRSNVFSLICNDGGSISVDATSSRAVLSK